MSDVEQLDQCFPIKRIRERIKFNAWKKIVKTLDKLPNEDRQCIINSVTILFGDDPK